MERADKILSGTGRWSRKECGELIRAGRVTADGNLVLRREDKYPSGTLFRVDGEAVSTETFTYLMLHKPAGVVSATDDPREATVLSLLPQHLRRVGLFPAGRLDKDTVGFVLITDDGEFAHEILSPKKHVEKRYFAVLEKPVSEREAELFASGMKIDGGDVCLPAELEITDDPCRVFITLREGMYHQIKRMAEASDNKILYLKRVSIGELELDENLAEGQCREILHKEIEKIYAKT